MNIQVSNVRPVSAIQEEKLTLEQEKAVLQQRVSELSQDKTTLMLAITDMYEMILSLLPEEE
ncbi:hypothetical protein P4U99_02945 [Brevibacillus agri]|uniref:hypothetical protein n=1 Tax=Brevibacillus agri TaxID=51101 RepID=UPI002E1ED810|nr:hypothetical protein [Brevibacillus agri]MED1654411.1 hypothetical protein [Brevibacillus agri]MED1688094.1 hypothetical protein [Brevibacillus agri]MED1691176.1 hypothetical protein [Brevibacillus agri]MED1699412.1 hypothetical protein [Brevibacillus agri]